jgi:tRNA (guanine37-N1)-methyltransferase
VRVPYLRIRQKDAEKEIDRLKASGEMLRDFRIRREGEWVLVPVKHSEETSDFEENPRIRMDHVGSFERVADFFVIKEREGWQEIIKEIEKKQSPRAIFLDSGVEGTFRIRKLQRVYGTGQPAGIHKENGLRYHIDLERAYFSPRLASLRTEIAESCTRLTKSGLIVDMYAGVGPISIPLLKRGLRVLSIDVNPAAVELLGQNMRLNKVKGNAIIADSNGVYDCLRGVEQVIMNHPTQSLPVTQGIIGKMKRGTYIHTTYISNRMDRIEFDGVEVLERKTVHGYSPSSSLFYFLLEKK